MAGNSSPAPFIKDEPEEFNFSNSNGFGMSQPYNAQLNSSQGLSGSIDPSQLTMGGSVLQRGFGSQSNLSSNFGGGFSSFADDELFDSLNMADPSAQHATTTEGDQSVFPQQNFNQSFFNGAASAPIRAQMNQLYSNTPEGGPIQSPFLNGHAFNYAQFQPAQSQQQQLQQQQQQIFGSGRPSAFDGHKGSLDMNMHGMRDVKHRTSMDTRSPMTQSLGGLKLGSADSNTLRGQPIQHRPAAQHSRQLSHSTAWDGTPGSSHSFVESPLSSPPNVPHNPQISEVLRSGKHASLPAKVGGPPVAAFQTQEAKKKRRRESHNLVERRRRDNINERIQELSHLVPDHRLDDEKIRKHLLNNTPLSPGANPASMSPPPPTGLLSGAGTKRVTGTITQGLPIEDKDKGPNKGDILNSAVSWTRDLMWMLHKKLQQESELLETITTLGGTAPYEITEDEQRMRTELLGTFERNNAASFEYSRGPGTGLHVPRHTQLNGEVLDPNSSQAQHDALGNDSAASGQYYAQSFWSPGLATENSMEPDSFKEEDEYDMEMS